MGDLKARRWVLKYEPMPGEVDSEPYWVSRGVWASELKEARRFDTRAAAEEEMKRWQFEPQNVRPVPVRPKRGRAAAPNGFDPMTPQTAEWLEDRERARGASAAPPAPTALEQAAERWRKVPEVERAEVCRAIREGEHHIDADAVALALLTAAAETKPTEAATDYNAAYAAAATARWRAVPKEGQRFACGLLAFGTTDPVQSAGEKAALALLLELAENAPARPDANRTAPPEPERRFHCTECGEPTTGAEIECAACIVKCDWCGQPSDRKYMSHGKFGHKRCGPHSVPPWLVVGARVRRKGTAREATVGLSGYDERPWAPHDNGNSIFTPQFYTTAEMVEKFEPAPAASHCTDHEWTASKAPGLDVCLHCPANRPTPVVSALIWFCASCKIEEPVQSGYVLGDSEPCVHCDNGVAVVMTSEMKSTAKPIRAFRKRPGARS